MHRHRRQRSAPVDGDAALGAAVLFQALFQGILVGRRALRLAAPVLRETPIWLEAAALTVVALGMVHPLGLPAGRLSR